MLNSFLDLLFPKTCIGCGRFGGYFCTNCAGEIKQTELVCPFCERASLGGAVHAVCKRRFGLDGLWSLGVYQGSLRVAIQKLKYRWVREMAKDLIDITLEYWVKNPPILLDRIKKDQGKAWVISAVPLHPARQKWRGFNQSELLAKLFAQNLGLTYQNTLKRIRNTKPQIKLLSAERKQNIKNAFELAISRQLSDVSILLVDDVWTTGSTLKECCYVLKRNGVKSVWALTIAR
ncbi:ComF family protein [Candidatus Daviesbacteria bacterium]|nr:ComF family protein [Candidatus Daviesbacteria bacterium]